MQAINIYTVEQVAKKLMVRKGFVYDLIYTGRLTAIRLSERRFRISEEALISFIEKEEAAYEQNISQYSSYQSIKEVDLNA